MSVIQEASALSKEADYYRNLILKKLRAQEDERRLTKFVVRNEFYHDSVAIFI